MVDSIRVAQPIRSQQDGRTLASFFFFAFMDLDSVSVHKNGMKELGQYSAILTSRQRANN